MCENSLNNRRQTVESIHGAEDRSNTLSMKESFQLLAQLGSTRMNAYGRTAAEDEFSVRMPNGEQKGFFKSFALPLAPFITMGRLPLYSQIHKPISDWLREHPQASFEEALTYLARQQKDSELSHNAQQAILVQEQWTVLCLERPAWLKTNTSEMLAQSIETDRHLTTILKEDIVDPDASPVEKIAHTAAQLNTVFGLMSPLYTVEALVDNKREDYPFDPIRKAQNELKTQEVKRRGNPTEALFESATHCIGQFLKSKKINPLKLNWDSLQQITNDILHDPANIASARILSELSWKLEADPVDVVFALWKRNNNSHGHLLVPEKEARTVFEESLQAAPPNENHELLVYNAQQLNAVFRFKGDMPAHRTEGSLTQGTDLIYGSVCDTMRKLDELVKSCPEIWTEAFMKDFEHIIKPQLEELPPYSSSKGRLLLELLLETPNAVKPEYLELIQNRVKDPERINRYVERLTALREEGQIREIGMGMSSTKLIGGKAAGQEYAQHFLANETTAQQEGAHIGIPNGIVITSERVEAMIQRSNPDLYRMILELDQSTDIKRNEELAQVIYQSIKNLTLTDKDRNDILGAVLNLNHKLVIRSSAADEATDERQSREHAGFYESHEATQEDMMPPLLDVIASYYNQGGVAFRDDRGLGHKLRMAVMFQDYFPQELGGNFLIQPGNPSQVTIKFADQASEITSGNEQFSLAHQTGDHSYNVKNNRPKMPARILEPLDAIYQRLLALQRRSGIVEWGSNGDRIMIFQQQMYPSADTTNPLSSVEPYPGILPFQYVIPASQAEMLPNIKELEHLLDSYEGPIQLIFPDNPDQLRIGSEFRALCIRYKNKIQSIKINTNAPSETSHLGCFISARFPWLNWKDIWL